MSRVATEPPASVSGWAPLRRPVFRALWLAQFVSTTGTWMQTVGAQWLMGDLGGGALAIALVQAITTLPVFLLVVPAGALGDILERRRAVAGRTGADVRGSRRDHGRHHRRPD